jgi:hypothetical protein
MSLRLLAQFREGRAKASRLDEAIRVSLEELGYGA